MIAREVFLELRAAHDATSVELGVPQRCLQSPQPVAREVLVLVQRHASLPPLSPQKDVVGNATVSSIDYVPAMRLNFHHHQQQTGRFS